MIDGREYMYFPPGPSLARMPLLAFTDELDGKLSAPSMLVAWCTSTLLLTLLIWRVRRILRPDAALSRGRGDRARRAGGEHLGGLGRALPRLDAVRVPRGLLVGDRHVARRRLLHARLPPAALHQGTLVKARRSSRSARCCAAPPPGGRARAASCSSRSGRSCAGPSVVPRRWVGRLVAGRAPPAVGGHRVQLGQVPPPVHVPARGPGVDGRERAAPPRPRGQRRRPRVAEHLPGHRHRLPPPGRHPLHRRCSPGSRLPARPAANYLRLVPRPVVPHREHHVVHAAAAAPRRSGGASPRYRPQGRPGAATMRIPLLAMLAIPGRHPLLRLHRVPLHVRGRPRPRAGRRGRLHRPGPAPRGPAARAGGGWPSPPSGVLAAVRLRGQPRGRASTPTGSTTPTSSATTSGSRRRSATARPASPSTTSCTPAPRSPTTGEADEYQIVGDCEALYVGTGEPLWPWMPVAAPRARAGTSTSAPSPRAGPTSRSRSPWPSPVDYPGEGVVLHIEDGTFRGTFDTDPGHPRAPRPAPPGERAPPPPPGERPRADAVRAGRHRQPRARARRHRELAPHPGLVPPAAHLPHRPRRADHGRRRADHPGARPPRWSTASTCRPRRPRYGERPCRSSSWVGVGAWVSRWAWPSPAPASAVTLFDVNAAAVEQVRGGHDALPRGRTPTTLLARRCSPTARSTPPPIRPPSPPPTTSSS